MKDKLSNLATAVLVLCAVVIVGLNVRRELFSRPAAGVRPQGMLVQNWREIVDAPRETSTAELELVVFADYTCRYCRRLETALDSVEAELGPRVNVRRLHFPLQPTGVGFTAAVASECAAEQRRGPAYHRLLYAHQDRLDAAPWDSLAALAGVPDRGAFQACVREQRTAEAVRRDRRRGDAVGAAVTPTFLVNGRMYIGGLTYSEIQGIVKGVAWLPDA